MTAEQLTTLLQQGIRLQEQGRLQDAARCYQHALDINPDHPHALYLSAAVCQQQDRHEQAVEFLERALQHVPDNVACLFNLGHSLLTLGRAREAAGRFQRVVTLRPGEARAWIRLGDALRLQGRLAGACQAYCKAAGQHPENIGLWQTLAELYTELERLDEAVRAFSKALAIDDRRVDLWLRLGQVEELRGNTEGVLSAYKRALQIQPDNPNGHYLLGNALSNLGRFGEAREAFHKALKLAPRFTAVYYALSLIRDYRFSPAERQCMTELHGDGSLSQEQRAYLDFALCRAAEQEQRYDEAFRFLAEGNRIIRSGFHYDSAEVEACFDRIRTVFDEDFFEQRSDFGVPDATPIFIVGMMRSGTSLVEQILASHPMVHGAGELTDLKQIIYYFEGDLDTMAYPEGVARLDNEQVEARAREYLARLARRFPNAQRVTDKMPGNFRYIGMIRLMFPRARIIHCMRDPLDTCLSCYRLHFSGVHRYAYDLSELGHYYRIYAQLMQHWRRVLPGHIHDVHYEDLIADQENETRRLLQFCGLPWDPACMDFHRAKRPVITASQSQVRKPIYRSALQGWRNYEAFLGPLIEALGVNPDEQSR